MNFHTRVDRQIERFASPQEPEMDRLSISAAIRVKMCELRPDVTVKTNTPGNCHVPLAIGPLATPRFSCKNKHSLT